MDAKSEWNFVAEQMLRESRFFFFFWVMNYQPRVKWQEKLKYLATFTPNRILHSNLSRIKRNHFNNKNGLCSYWLLKWKWFESWKWSLKLPQWYIPGCSFFSWKKYIKIRQYESLEKSMNLELRSRKSQMEVINTRYSQFKFSDDINLFHFGSSNVCSCIFL